MAVIPKTIIMSGLDKVIVTDGICRQGSDPYNMRPGMSIILCSDESLRGMGYKLDNAINADMQRTNGAVVLESIENGIDVDYVFSDGERIKVAWLRDGMSFWGRVIKDEAIQVGDYIGPGGEKYLSTDGTYAKSNMDIHTGFGDIPVFGIALTPVEAGTNWRWVLIRVGPGD